MLTPDQQNIINLAEKGKNLFITGMAGTGKTLTINYFIDKYKYSKKIGITSTTGVSALLLKGTTLHSFLGIGLGKSSVEVMYSQIFKKKFLRNRWRKLDILIIDEVSMLLPELFDKLEELARMLRESVKPFGGIQLILTGDMLQLPPVKSEKFCFEAEKWDKCIEHTIYLRENLRQNDKFFQECLTEARLGFLSCKNEKLLKSRENAKLENEVGIIPTKILSLNMEVDEINYNQMNKLDTDLYEYEIEIDNLKKPYMLEKIKKNCNMVDNLYLCIGAQVMLLTNLDIEAGFVNGSRGVVIKFIDDIPVVKFMNGFEVSIDYHTIEIEENDDILCVITQIPLRVAYAVSAHKIQGQTLDCCEINLKNFFDYGQAYVALSRVRNINCLRLKNFEKNKIKAHPKAIKFYNKFT